MDVDRITQTPPLPAKYDFTNIRERFHSTQASPPNDEFDPMEFPDEISL